MTISTKYAIVTSLLQCLLLDVKRCLFSVQKAFLVSKHRANHHLSNCLNSHRTDKV